jgi:hypothetical protein
MDGAIRDSERGHPHAVTRAALIVEGRKLKSIAADGRMSDSSAARLFVFLRREDDGDGMTKGSAKTAGFLLLAFASSVSAAPPLPFDDTRLPPQVQRIDGVLVPVPSEIFRTLVTFRNPNWTAVAHPELATLPTAGGSAQIALSLGLVVAEGFIAVAAEDASGVQDLGREAQKLARALGVEKSVVGRANSVIDHARKKEWSVVREEWTGVNADIKQAMIEIGSEPLSQLVSLGGWLRGTDALSALISQDYSVEGARLLSQPALLRYFGDLIVQMESKIRADPAVIEMEKGVTELRPLIGTSNQTPISEQQVRDIANLAGALVRSIYTKAP